MRSGAVLGSATAIHARNGIPHSYQRALAGALLFALQDLIVDPKFVDYMHR